LNPYFENYRPRSTQLNKYGPCLRKQSSQCEIETAWPPSTTMLLRTSGTLEPTVSCPAFPTNRTVMLISCVFQSTETCTDEFSVCDVSTRLDSIISKPHTCGCNLDACSFFTRCSRTDCIQFAQNLISKMREKGVQEVWLGKEPRHRDRIGRAGIKPSAVVTALPLEDIQSALQFLAVDNLIQIGDTVFLQALGLRQGNPFSPILARLLLDTLP
jgi:hypothetical protein